MTTPAAPPRASVVAAVDAVQAWVERRKRAVARDMHECGQSPAQVHLLGLLNELGPTTVSHVAALLGTTPPSASAMVDRMVDTGLVVRERNEDDRRVVTVSIGPGGKEALQVALGGRREMLERVLSQLDDEELRATLRVMARLEEAITNAS
ncbi:MAG: MarR family transcriptional regulator [Candidatus Dormibacter sp.]